MKQTITKHLMIAAGLLLPLLVFSSCSDESTSSSGSSEPYANYRVFGSVTDEEGNSIKGIQVISELRSGNTEDDFYQLDTIRTNVNGQFDTLMKVFPLSVTSFTFNDIDKEENGGEFASLRQSVTIVRTKLGSGLYTGDFDMSADVKLKKK